MNKQPIRNSSDNKWLYDEYNDGLGLSFKIQDILEEIQTKFQKITIAKSNNLGNVLLINNLLYRTEDFGSVMPEMIVHVPMNSGKSQKKRILLIGGGDGYSLTEIVKYLEVEHIDLVDIDNVIIDLCKKYFFNVKDAFLDKRVRINIKEGSEFLKNTENGLYDVIFVTGTEALDSAGKPGISFPLFQNQFYQDCFNKLTDNGILLTDGQNGYYGGNFYKASVKQLKKLFPVVKPYVVASKYIPGGLYVINIASKKYDPEKDIKATKLTDLKYYTSKIHQGSFALPKFLL